MLKSLPSMCFFFISVRKGGGAWGALAPPGRPRLDKNSMFLHFFEKNSMFFTVFLAKSMFLPPQKKSLRKPMVFHFFDLFSPNLVIHFYL